MAREASVALTLALALALPLLAGCLAPKPDLSHMSVFGPAPAKYLYDCSGNAAEKPCAGRVADLRTSYQEPYVAGDGKRPGVFVVGLNAGPSAVDNALALPDGKAAECRNDLLVTEDAGKSWRYVETPRPPVSAAKAPVYCGGDPALAFDSAGTLHLTGIATADVQSNGFEVYYASSPDLGKTWSKPVVLSKGANEDRNWIAIAGDTVLVAWQHFDGDGGSALAVSEDAGKSWQTLLPPEMAKCFTVSPPIVDGARALLACAAYVETDPEIRVVSYDLANRTFAKVSALKSADYWPHLAFAGDSLYLFAERSDSAGPASSATTEEFAVSLDRGATWSRLAPAKAFVPDGLPSGNYWLQWAERDAWGRVHLLWRATSALPTGDTMESAFGHSVLQADGATLQKARIGEGEALVEPRQPDTIGTSLGNHYMGIAWSAASGMMVWSEHGVIEWARLAPG